MNWNGSITSCEQMLKVRIKDLESRSEGIVI